MEAVNCVERILAETLFCSVLFCFAIYNPDLVFSLGEIQAAAQPFQPLKTNMSVSSA